MEITLTQEQLKVLVELPTDFIQKAIDRAFHPHLSLEKRTRERAILAVIAKTDGKLSKKELDDAVDALIAADKKAREDKLAERDKTREDRKLHV